MDKTSLNHPSRNMEENKQILDNEWEALQSIYVDEIQINVKSPCTSVLIDLHPATADNVDEKYVKMTLKFNIDNKYPDVVPDIKIQNPRGLSDEKLNSIIQSLRSLAESKKGCSMLFEIIERAKEHLTTENRPCGECAICLYGFSEKDIFTKTSCYHYFHSHCLARYACNAEIVALSEEINSSKIPELLCPMCRFPIQFDCSGTFPPPDTGDLDFALSEEIVAVQKEMADLYQRQLKNGGIINIEEEKNKFVLEISNVTTHVKVIEQTKSCVQETGPVDDQNIMNEVSNDSDLSEPNNIKFYKKKIETINFNANKAHCSNDFNEQHNLHEFKKYGQHKNRRHNEHTTFKTTKYQNIILPNNIKENDNDFSEKDKFQEISINPHIKQSHSFHNRSNWGVKNYYQRGKFNKNFDKSNYSRKPNMYQDRNNCDYGKTSSNSYNFQKYIASHEINSQSTEKKIYRLHKNIVDINSKNYKLPEDSYTDFSTDDTNYNSDRNIYNGPYRNCNYKGQKNRNNYGKRNMIVTDQLVAESKSLSKNPNGECIKKHLNEKVTYKDSAFKELSTNKVKDLKNCIQMEEVDIGELSIFDDEKRNRIQRKNNKSNQSKLTAISTNQRNKREPSVGKDKKSYCLPTGNKNNQSEHIPEKHQENRQKLNTLENCLKKSTSLDCSNFKKPDYNKFGMKLINEMNQHQNNATENDSSEGKINTVNGKEFECAKILDFQDELTNQTTLTKSLPGNAHSVGSVLPPPPGFTNPLKMVIYGLSSANPPPGFSQS